MRNRRIVNVLLATGVASAIVLAGGPLSAQTMTDDWTKIVEAAKAEGELIVWGQAGRARRAFWKDAFEDAYPGIKVNLFQANRNSERDTRYLRELKAGVAKVDLFVGGSGGATVRLKPIGALQPLKPFLKPEILDPKNWDTPDGGPIWMDLQREFMLVSDAIAYPPVALHKSIGENELSSWDDLLKSKYDRQIVMGDPRRSGPGFAMGLFLYHTPAFGPSYMKKLFANGRVVFSSDERQNVEWIDSGRVKIGIGTRPQEVEALQKIGGKIRMKSSLTRKGQPHGSVSSSDGILFIPNVDPLPHRNAALVYINWFYSKAGQQAMIDRLETPSYRADVDDSKLSKWSKRFKGVRYSNMNDEKNYVQRSKVKEMREFVSQIVGGK